jgi:aminopeptidase N
MIESTKMSLDYFTKNFSPYQHKQFRIFEFPRYSTFAQAFPNTIPFSEGIGFIAKVDKEDPEDIDYPFYVTAHELAHQWWAHQVIGGGVQGVTMLSETFSQYSALMVMEKRYGKERMRKFLKYELSRYLSGRGHEHEGENPLYLNENQSYIHYRKGSLVMYALKDYIGEDLVNETMRDFIKMTAYQQGPFTNTKEFLSLLKSKLTKQEDHQLVEDLFEKIVLFDNRMMEASYTRLNNGQYSVKVKIKSAKVYSDEQGKETHANFSLPIYISAQDEKKNFLYLKKHMLKSGENEVEFMVKEKPHKAGVDPLNILVDKNPDDNTSKLKERSKA